MLPSDGVPREKWVKKLRAEMITVGDLWHHPNSSKPENVRKAHYLKSTICSTTTVAGGRPTKEELKILGH
jgi:hypothetical protein